MRFARSFPVCLAFVLLPAGPAAADGFMSLQDFQFAPAAAQIQPGEKVDFNFEGPSEHDVVIRRGQVDRYDSGVTGPGMTKSHRFLHPGSFALLCDIHPSMKARVAVGAPETLKPRLSRLRARPGARKVRLSFRTSERSVVTVAIGSRRVSKVLARGARSITVTRLRPGRRTAVVSTKDGWGNRSAGARRSFRVR
jgi:hypothetical protein